MYVSSVEWNTESSHELQMQWTPDVSHSPLWEEDIRREVRETKLSEQQINTLRSKLLVPGEFDDLKDQYVHVSVYR